MWRLTDEQRELREQIRQFAIDEVRPRMLEVDDTCDYPFDVHKALSRAGYIGLAIPEKYGGGGAGSVEFCAYIEELAKVSATASLMAAYVKLTSLPIMLAGSAEQQQEWVPPPAPRGPPRAARARLRGAARVLRADRAGRGLGPRGPADTGGAPRRRLGAQRAEALHRQ